MSSIFNRYVESGYFMTKTAWKKTIRQAINNFYCNDLMSRVTSVKPYNRFLKIHVDITLGPHILWKLSKEYPRFKGMAQVAVRLIGMLFSGKWLRKCCNCGETNLLLTEHLLLYCPYTDSFRKVLWYKLLGRLGVQFYKRFKSLSPSDQIDGLFSGCSDILTDDADRWECLKIFITSLKVLQDKVNFSNTYTRLT